MKVAPVADVKARFSAYVANCRKSPVVVTKNGRPAAMLVPVPEGEEELERFILAHTPSFRALLDAAHARIEQSGGLAHADLWRATSRRRSGAAKR
jgi:prevent-host-death family protein